MTIAAEDLRSLREVDNTMEDIRSRIEAILPHVRTPGQYIGGEINSIRKDLSSVAVKVCLVFPEVYSVGMSHIGLKILYEVLNRRPDIAAERAFAPWVDLARFLKERNIPLYSLENFCPLREFDIIGFSLQYELLYTNVLMILELAGLPVRSSERRDADPLVIAGGPGAFSPEPLADFIDAFVLGDGEDVIIELADFVKATKGMPRPQRLLEMARSIKGVYVPSLYEVAYNSDGTVARIRPLHEGVPERIERRIVHDLDASIYPTAPVVPFVETIHDRYAVEIMRGCTNKCRFCQAGVNYRPRRERSVEKILELAREGIRNTGYDELALASLSTSDYSRFSELMRRLNEEFTPMGVSLSVPSLRADSLLKDVPPSVNEVRKSGLTIAPECASDRLRRAIAKPIKNADLYAGVKAAYDEGWETVKLYFMIGLPGETDSDVQAIAEMANEVCFLRKRSGRAPAKVNVSVSTFVPKAHTPFQWEVLIPREEILRRQALIKKGLKSARIKVSFHDPDVSELEAVFSRGDRRLGKVLLEARARGCAFDAWTEQFKASAWREAFAASGLDPDFYARRIRSTDELLPWAHLDGGASQDFLLRELKNARAALAEDSPSATTS